MICSEDQPYQNTNVAIRYFSAQTYELQGLQGGLCHE
jgi:hypothetical protein